MSNISVVRFKVCTKCGCTKPQTFDFFSRHTKNGMASACKSCQSLAWKAYYKKNRKEVLQKKADYDVAYRSANLQRLSEAQKQRNKDKRIKQPEATRARGRKLQSRYRAANPAKIKADRAKRRALENNAPGKHSAEEIERMYLDQAGLCAYCEKLLEVDFHVDHMIPLSRGGANGWENLAIACSSCNLSKGVLNAVEFMAPRI